MRTIACLPALIGSWRDRGGGLLYTTRELHAQVLNLQSVSRPEMENLKTRSFNMIQLGRALTDENLKPRVKALVVYDSNPATTTPNQELVLEGLRREDLLTVVHEQFMTDTARYADYVLPATTALEQLDLLYPYGHTYVVLNKPAIHPLGEAVSNAEFFRRLAGAMGFSEACFQESDEEMVRTALVSEHPAMRGITYEGLEQQGWMSLRLDEDWRPFAEGGFRTRNGKCVLDGPWLDRVSGVQPAPEGDEGYPLRLITAKSAVHFLNSSYANLPRHLKGEGEPLLDVHPTDAASYNLADGDLVRVFNSRGEITIRARIGSRVRPGVVTMPHGWWTAGIAGASGANALTGDGLADMGGGGDFYGTRVDIARVEPAVPATVATERN
jgi:anaerobic selenocysteine-containing dehydrogenase